MGQEFNSFTGAKPTSIDNRFTHQNVAYFDRSCGIRNLRFCQKTMIVVFVDTPLIELESLSFLLLWSGENAVNSWAWSNGLKPYRGRKPYCSVEVEEAPFRIHLFPGGTLLRSFSFSTLVIEKTFMSLSTSASTYRTTFRCLVGSCSLTCFKLLFSSSPLAGVRMMIVYLSRVV